MEKITNLPLLDKESLIQAAYAEKRGRESFTENPFTCYVNIDSPEPDLSHLTASLLDQLRLKPLEAFLWTKAWDKSVIVLNPKVPVGCHLLESTDPKGKLFVPVTTTSPVKIENMVRSLPSGELAVIGVNAEAVTVDAFLICYMHLVNELVWSMSFAESNDEKVTVSAYKRAIEMVVEKGFMVVLMSEEEILSAKSQQPESSLRIYGSMVNKYVPKVMGVVIK